MQCFFAFLVVKVPFDALTLAQGKLVRDKLFVLLPSKFSKDLQTKSRMLMRFCL